MGIVKTVLFGEMEIPDEREAIIMELRMCKQGFRFRPSRYMQTRIDYLEYALDMFRRDGDV